MVNKSLCSFGLLACLFLGWSGARAESTVTSVEFGKVRLTLGLSQDGVLAKLAQEYRIDRGDEGLYLVTGKDEPHRTVGSIRFRDGRLVSIYRNWAEFQQQGAELASSFYRLARVFVQEGRTACTINAGENEQADSEDRFVLIKCGRKSIGVRVTRIPNVPEVATVEESLEAE